MTIATTQLAEHRSAIPPLPGSPSVLRVCVLVSSASQSTSDIAPYDALQRTPAVYFKDDPRYTFAYHELHKATAVPAVRDLVQSGQYDVFFNLCDGAWDEDRAGKEVVEALEAFGVPYTGADAAFYDPSKALMKMMAHYEGVASPNYVLVEQPEDIEAAVLHLRFPVICKPPRGYSSVGITEVSRCADAQALRAQASRLLGAGGGALIEEFIDGREVTVLVVEEPDGVRACVPMECVFPAGQTFKHFDLKWKDWRGLHWQPLGPDDRDLAEQVMHASVAVFRALKGSGYARADFRVGPGGDAFFLELNPNAGVLYPCDAYASADHVLQHDPLGHKGFVELLLRSALARHHAARAARTVRVACDPVHGYGLQAARDIQAGELVVKYEGTQHTLISRAKVEAEWGPGALRDFARYAYPISDDVWCMWSNDPADWRPVNHSCDPNCWFGGAWTVVGESVVLHPNPAEHHRMDVYARKPIARGEPITLEYATFATDFEAFDCTCGAQGCRGRVAPSDLVSGRVLPAYGTRVSAYVQRWVHKQSSGPWQG